MPKDTTAGWDWARFQKFSFPAPKNIKMFREEKQDFIFL